MSYELASGLKNAGLDVFPCTNKKAPAVRKGSAWSDEAKRPPIEHTWRSGIVGVPVPEGVMVLDLDTYKGITRADVERIVGAPLPWDAALIQRTMNGGEHYAFRVDFDPRQLQNAEAHGLDTRAAGRGYIATGLGYAPCGFGVFALSQPHALPELPHAAREWFKRKERTPTEAPELPTGDKEIPHLLAALRHVRPDCDRAAWVKIGLALRNHFHDDELTGLAIFNDWSAGLFTPTGEAPHNYDAEAIEHQWFSFKPEGATRIGTLYHKAIEGGWTPPAGIDTAAAFGQGAVSVEAFAGLVDRITESGGDPKAVDRLVQDVAGLACSELQKSILTASLLREMKEAGILTPELRAMLTGKAAKAAAPSGLYGKNHTENAALFISRVFPDGKLVRLDQTWYAYTGRVWCTLEDETLKAMVSAELWQSSPMASVIAGTVSQIENATHDNRRKLGDGMADRVAYRNGVLCLRTGALMPHDMANFTTTMLPYDFKSLSYQCDDWIQFLNEVFDGDSDRVALLQEWFGYMLASSYEFHKMMLLLGPPRSGKGTIGKVLHALVGDDNFSGGSLRAFTSDKFLDSLQRKTVVFIGDAEKRVAGNLISHLIERFKTISGNDAINFDRIYKKSVTTALPSRVTIAGNNVPALFDDSGALQGRLLVLPMYNSFLGREDSGLVDRLMQSIEGIAAWALHGLFRLRGNGRFTSPHASEAEIDYIRETYSPITTFMDQCCLVTRAPSDRVSGGDLYDTYHAWAIGQQEDNILSRRAFTSSFKDASRGTGARYAVYRAADGETLRGFVGMVLLPFKHGGGSIPLSAVK